MQSVVIVKFALNRFVHKGMTHGYRFPANVTEPRCKEEREIVKFKYINIHYYRPDI